MFFEDKPDEDAYFLPNGRKVIDKPQLKYITYSIWGFKDHNAADLFMNILHDSPLKTILDPYSFISFTSDGTIKLTITGWYTESILSEIVEFTRIFEGLSVTAE